jgi:hypothetical protein
VRNDRALVALLPLRDQDRSLLDVGNASRMLGKAIFTIVASRNARNARKDPTGQTADPYNRPRRAVC